jgi:hypothetical protein
MTENTDPLEVSRFPLNNPSDITLNKIQELKLIQKLLKEIKFVQSLDESVLREQKLYWLYTHNIKCNETKTRIKTALESHCSAHMNWIGDNEFEININPNCKVLKIEKPQRKKGTEKS